MARKYDVTRNFDIYEVNCVLFNDDTENTEKITFTSDNKDISRKALERYVHDTKGKKYTLVKFTVNSIGSVMYGMTSADFMKYGVQLNPDNRQPLVTAGNEDTDSTSNEDINSDNDEYTDSTSNEDNE